MINPGVRSCPFTRRVHAAGCVNFTCTFLPSERFDTESYIACTIIHVILIDLNTNGYNVNNLVMY